MLTQSGEDLERGQPAAVLAVVLLCAGLVLQLTKGKITEICLVLG